MYNREIRITDIGRPTAALTGGLDVELRKNIESGVRECWVLVAGCSVLESEHVGGLCCCENQRWIEVIANDRLGEESPGQM